MAQKRKKSVTLLLTLLALYTAGKGQERDEQEEFPWTVDVGARYVSRFTNHGIDLGQDQAALPFGFGISHRSGFSATGEAVNVLGPAGGIQQSSVALEYDRSLSDLLSVSFEFNHYFYQSDTLNVLSGLSNSFSVNADFDFESVSISVFYDLYLGGGGANYFGMSVSGYFTSGELVAVPLLQVGFVSQQVQGTFLKANRGKPRTQIGTVAQTITGMSNTSVLMILMYPLGEGFSVSLTPSFVYSPSELSTRSSQFIWSAGIKYSLDF